MEQRRDESIMHGTPLSKFTSTPFSKAKTLDATEVEPAHLDEDEEQASTKPILPQRKPPIAAQWCILPCILFIGYIASGAYYFSVRINGVFGGGDPDAYHVYFLALEFLGVTAFLPYAILLTRGVFPTGSIGLPPAGLEDDVSCFSESIDGECRMHVRVLVPCYKEPLEVVTATVNAALNADLPAFVKRTVYLCDDGKDPEKQAFIESIAGGHAVYVTGRTRKPNEINGKSANLNNCLRRIYQDLPQDETTGEVDWSEISNKELLVVFDADMCAKPYFFLRILEVMQDENLALCLTPQAFHNIDPGIDLFNSINVQFWEYWLPGAFAWGYIACTGTNFCLRARALAHCGWFPEYTITEDYALGMEMKSRGYKATYLMDYIAEGEAPVEIRNVFQQRSRWTKGHYQVFFSRRNPLINWDLPFFQRLWYACAAWSPFCTTITVPAFMLAPLVSVVWGVHPLLITYDFVLASTLYFAVQMGVQFYVRKLSHLKLMWYVNQSNVVLWFTYTKALINCTMAAMGLKNVMFKVTAKVVKSTGDAASKPTAALHDHETPGKLVAALRMASRTVSKVSSTLRNVLTPRKTPSSRLVLMPSKSVEPGKLPSRNSVSRKSPTTSGTLDPLDHNIRISAHQGGYTGNTQDELKHAPASGNLQLRSRISPLGSLGPLSSMEGGHIDVKRMDAPRLPEDTTHVVAPMQELKFSVTQMDPVEEYEDDSFRQHAWADPGPSISQANTPTKRGKAKTTKFAGAASRLSAVAKSPKAAIHGPAPVSLALAHDTFSSGAHAGSSQFTDASSALSQDNSTAQPVGAPRVRLTDRFSLASKQSGARVDWAQGDHQSKASETLLAGQLLPQPGVRSQETGRTSESAGSLGQGSKPLPQHQLYPNTAPAAGPYVHVDRGVMTMTHCPPMPTLVSAPPGVDLPIVMPHIFTISAASSNDGVTHSIPTHGYAQMPARVPGQHDQDLSKASKVNLLAGGQEGTTPRRRLKPAGVGDSAQEPGKQEPPPEVTAKPGKERAMKILRSYKPQNVADISKMFDPLALLIMWMLNVTICALAIWQLANLFKKPTVAAFKLSSPLSGNPYLIIAVLWTVYNSMAPYMFLHYCFSSGKSFRKLTSILPSLSSLCTVVAAVLLWLMIPSDVQLADALDLSIKNFLPAQIVHDTNQNFLFVSGLAATPILLSSLLARAPGDALSFASGLNTSRLMLSAPHLDVNLLGGILAGPDHVKSVQPTTHAITWLSWAVTQFPSGFAAPGHLKAVQDVIKAGADYLMQCNLNLKDPANPVFVAQLGDHGDYAVVDHAGYDPVAQGKVWSSPAQDPYLSGQLPRKAWLLTREAVGTDLLAGAAGALAAASLIMRPRDPAWSHQALLHARYLYNFARLNTTQPSSYCQFMPCFTNVTVSEQVKAKPAKEQDGIPLCWYADWVTRTCRIGLTERECNRVRRKISDVFLTKSGCCAAMVESHSWDTTYTKAQGVCALPDDQWTCYIPDLAQRTCYAQAINRTTGSGCSGKAIEVFATPLSCCNYLNEKGVIDQSGSKPAVGLCSRTNIDLAQTKCYLPNIVNGTCDESFGEQCAQFGIQTSFDQPLACCNHLAEMMKSTQLVKKNDMLQVTYVTLSGICAPYVAPSPPMAPYIGIMDLGEIDTDDTSVLDTGGATPEELTPVETTPGFEPNEDLLDITDLIDTSAPSTTVTPLVPAGWRRSLVAGHQSSGLAATPHYEGWIEEAWKELNKEEDSEHDFEYEENTLDVSSGCPKELPSTTTSVPAPSNSPLLSRGVLTRLWNKLRSRVLPRQEASPSINDVQHMKLTPGRRQLQQSGSHEADANTQSRLLELMALLGSKGKADSRDATTTFTGLSASAKNTSDNTTYWPLPMGKAFLEDPCLKPGSCTHIYITKNVTVTHFNSSSVFDDVAWAAIWLHKATGEPGYLGEAQHFLDRHYQEELAPDAFLTSRSIYVPNWDNQAWAVNAMLAEATTSKTYHNRMRSMLSTWVFGDSIPEPVQTGLDLDTILNGRNFTTFTLPNTNKTFEIISECVPTNTFEQYCFDGLDDDCNGLVDREDPACGLFPVLYSPKEVAWTTAPSLPHAANAAFLALAYSNSMSGTTQTRLRCWALSQVGHMLGSGYGERSYVVGVGNEPPTLVQQRASSCPVDTINYSTILLTGLQPTEPVCDWASGFYPSSPNPGLKLLAGALISGPNRHDELTERRSAQDMLVTLHDNAGFLGSMAALQATDTRLRSCEALHGVFQRYITNERTLE